MTKDEWNKDEIVSHVDIHFDFVDRLRILFGRVALVTVRVDTENVVGRTVSESTVHVQPIFPRKHGPGAVEAETI